MHWIIPMDCHPKSSKIIQITHPPTHQQPAYRRAQSQKDFIAALRGLRDLAVGDAKPFS